MKKEIRLEKEQMYRGNLILVNAQHPLRNQEQIHKYGWQPEAPEDLVPVCGGACAILLQRQAAASLQLALAKTGAGEQIVPVSGYRSKAEQMAVWNDSLRENGKAFTEKYVARPNHSEHQTGLAIDLGLRQEEIDFIRPSFPYEGICQAFRQTAPEYGFIERYKKGKEGVTNIAQEPWHFRYVGYPHSKIIEKAGLVLEEYIEWIKSCTAKSGLIFRGQGRKWLVYAVLAEEEGDTAVWIPQADGCRISGNHVDGFIVTAWEKVR